MNRKSFLRNIFGTIALQVLKPVLPLIPEMVNKNVIVDTSWLDNAMREYERQWFKEMEMAIWYGTPNVNK